MASSDLQHIQQECARVLDTALTAAQKPLVFGEGYSKKPILMLVGEAPGAQEVIEGRPFVGKAGKNLDGFLTALGLTREEIYISNVVKIRPTREGKTGRICNRPPTREEILLFQPWLMREVLIIKPKALVTLGNVALHAFMPLQDTIGSCHGKWQTAIVRDGDTESRTIPLFALYHPASIIYRAELKEVYQNDLEALRDSLYQGGQNDT